MLPNTIENKTREATSENSDKPKGEKLQKRAITMTKTMLMLTHQSKESKSKIRLVGNINLTKHKPGTKKIITKPKNHLIITNGNNVDGIKETETAEETEDKATIQYHAVDDEKIGQLRLPNSTFSSCDFFAVMKPDLQIFSKFRRFRSFFLLLVLLNKSTY